MKRALVAMLAAAALAGCAGQNAAQQTAAGIMGSYTVAATGIASYAASPGADPAKVTMLRQCDAAAWTAVQPVAVALQKGTVPTVSANSAATAALGALDGCLTANGVKVQ